MTGPSTPTRQRTITVGIPTDRRRPNTATSAAEGVSTVVRERPPVRDQGPGSDVGDEAGQLLDEAGRAVVWTTAGPLAASLRPATTRRSASD